MGVCIAPVSGNVAKFVIRIRTCSGGRYDRSRLRLQLEKWLSRLDRRSSPSWYLFARPQQSSAGVGRCGTHQIAPATYASFIRSPCIRAVPWFSYRQWRLANIKVVQLVNVRMCASSGSLFFFSHHASLHSRIEFGGMGIAVLASSLDRHKLDLLTTISIALKSKADGAEL
jgi:hypothetical protein